MSPYLFLLVVELLGCLIRNDNTIRGLEVQNRNIKLLQYADDTNGFLADVQSAKNFLKSVTIKRDSYDGLPEKIQKLFLEKIREYQLNDKEFYEPRIHIKLKGIAYEI